MRVLPPSVRFLLGLAGSIAIALGSYGVGWIGPESTLHDWAALEFIRNSRGGVTIAGLLVVVGALMLLVAWITLGLSLLERRGTRGGRDETRLQGDTRTAHDSRSAARRTSLNEVVASAAAWAAPLLFSLPLFSRDMFAYIGQGRLMAAGLNPYTSGMAALPGWYGIGVDPLWADTSTPYGPVFVWLERVVVQSTDALPTEVAVFAFRLLAAAGLAMLAYYAWRIARLRGLNEAGVLWIVAASPLVVMNFVAAGHNDSIMLAFIVGGVYYALRDRPLLGTVFVTIAIGVKPIALIALPIIGLIWAGAAAGWGAIVRRWAAVAGIALGGLALVGWSLGIGMGWLGALATPVSISSWYAPANILGIGVGGLFEGVGLDGEVAQTVVKLALLGAGCTLAAYLVIARRRLEPLTLLLGCFAAIVLSSPVVHPWYGLWLLTLLALKGAERLWSMRTVVYSTVFFMLIGLAEPLDLIPRLETDTRIPVIIVGVALVGTTAVLIGSELLVRRRRVALGFRMPEPA
ncbi:polyprenol phosphomannose-dependent alpha 1,6 mannosyltransferase MptB [Herbiconiux sp. CPCC 205716]|uniref:Polyprenol phosphomannose-dependent alpha 1,6 mannosyltransferase MptB n=1 Tax=Herbiconiux gentiana TaxID=2970912 RepID=A0ABT2GKI0_9MICO|nr:polyprenol phosphomannose-dependent alpha 1,6 mannosyltransferase MptB [Herbiconiux gentiana]MCS5715800.1 polyprenol phosphomannose-dependent alpha 1,6 mannosyltransferase MptB [Herbiconiux gentiana]